MLASATFVAEVLAAGFFFPLFILAVIFSRATWSNALVPPTIAANDGMGPFGGCGGAPLAGGAWGEGTTKGHGRDDWVWSGALTCAGGRCGTLCDRSCRLDWIWLSGVE